MNYFKFISMIIFLFIVFFTTVSTAEHLSNIIKIQKQLKQLGYDPGPIDGIFGKKTKTALINFQHDNGIIPNGEVNDSTKFKLGIKLKSNIITTKSSKDISSRYKWKSEWNLPFSGSGYTIIETVNNKGRKGYKISLTEKGKGSIPTIGSDILTDLPGSKNVTIGIDTNIGSTTYVGLTFKKTCTLDILKDSTVVSHQENVIAVDKNNKIWTSNPVQLEGKTYNCFFLSK